MWESEVGSRVGLQLLAVLLFLLTCAIAGMFFCVILAKRQALTYGCQESRHGMSLWQMPHISGAYSFLNMIGFWYCDLYWSHSNDDILWNTDKAVAIGVLSVIFSLGHIPKNYFKSLLFFSALFILLQHLLLPEVSQAKVTQGNESVTLVTFLAEFEVTDVVINIRKWRLFFYKTLSWHGDLN